MGDCSGDGPSVNNLGPCFPQLKASQTSDLRVSDRLSMWPDTTPSSTAAVKLEKIQGETARDSGRLWAVGQGRGRADKTTLNSDNRNTFFPVSQLILVVPFF